MRTRSTSLSTPAQTRWQRFASRSLPMIVVGLMVAAVMVAVVYPHVVVTVPTGHVGVLWKRLGGFNVYCWCVVRSGTVLEPQQLRDEGLHIIWPWDRLFLYDLRLQTATETYNAISKDGVSITATINVRFQLKHNSVPQLHKFIGPEYVTLLVRPEIGSRAREIIAQYSAEEVYSTARQTIENAIRENAQIKLGSQLNRLVQPETIDPSHAQDQGLLIRQLSESIDIVDTLVLGISLPEVVMAAINRKIEQLYVAQEYEYRLIREAKESERKRIEAAGIRDFQQIVSQGISDSYLRWRGIEATLQLAQSSNAKTVIIGSNKDGLPIILGNADAPTPTAVSSNGGAPPIQTAAPPPAASETAPAAAAASPFENTRPRDPASPSPATPQNSATPPKPQSFFAPSWSDIQTMISQTPVRTAPATPPDQPAAERPR
jgi:regulator of protease activity HflC (stomatin/prohibitin superfamily)